MIPPPDDSCQAVWEEKAKRPCPCIIKDRKIIAKELREIINNNDNYSFEFHKKLNELIEQLEVTK